jgi:thiamine biosynthesis protein ThiI
VEQFDTVLVRYGEVCVKSSSVHREWSRIIIETRPESVGAATEATTHVGVSSASPCLVADASVESIAEAVVGVARREYDGGTFAVRARRACEATESLARYVPDGLSVLAEESVEDATAEVFDCGGT